MRVHNITDMPTQALKAAGLVCVSLQVNGVIIKPGESQVVSNLGTNADRFIRVGALHVGDELPKGYKPVPKIEAPKRVLLELTDQVFVTDSVTVTLPGLPHEDAPSEETRAERRRRQRAERQDEG